jgi:hypothetical protein
VNAPLGDGGGLFGAIQIDHNQFMPVFWDIDCTSCDYRSEGYRHFGQFYAYLLPDQTTLSLPFICAWCRGCNEVTHAEEMPTLAKIQAELESASRLPDWRLKELNILQKWRPQRVSLPKCLTCGSADFEPITVAFYNNPGPIECPHPGCNGKLRFRAVGRYTLGPVQQQHLFSLEGDYLNRTVEWRSFGV